MNPDPKDPIAQHLDWSPIKSGGANFKTHKLLDETVNLRFTPTLFAHLFVLAFAAISVFLILNQYTDILNTPIDGPDWLKDLAPLIFLGGTIWLIYDVYKPRIFNIRDRVYRHGWFKAELEVNQVHASNTVHFSNIHSLQIVNEEICDEDGCYTSTELNLVLKKGERINVIDHADRECIIQDASTLAKILKVPVWHK